MSSQAYFGDQELYLVDRALVVAEDSVGNYFRLAESNWFKYPYELRTGVELDPQEVCSQALAQVMRLHRPPVGDRIRGKDFFRICLQDHNLLDVIKRDKAEGLLLPLLTYVLAHELVHVLRFYRFHHLYDAEPHKRLQEESKVHAITAQALAKAGLPEMDRVIGLYEQHAQAMQEAAW